ncbi:hypothetical protein DSO57_1028593 [Entomophthora muscae]|uniref:Uncharacterized protein n=1 Tax=Entomophthora muscae TaxID=34485 RepID=A0ACC2TNN4_9FUNG|nr:hypothetical protein DSO57_1028593 [Entomophthora muscae]
MKLNTYTATKLTTKNSRYPLEESTWELLSNLNNSQEAAQLYLNKKNKKGGLLGEEGGGVRIENSSSLETQSREQELNLDPGPPPLGLWTAGPPACAFLGSSPHKLIPRMLAHAVK